MKVIKVEDQKRRMADARPYSSPNTSNKCKVCVSATVSSYAFETWIPRIS